MSEEIASAFVSEARRLLRDDYLPKIERCLDALPPADLWWRPHDSSNSVGNLLLHLEGNARQWIVSGVGGAPDRRERQAEFDAGKGGEADAGPPPDARQLLARLRSTLGEVDAVLAGLDASALLESRAIQGLPRVSVLGAVFHVVEHFSMHTGQIILLAKLRGGADLAFYDFSSGAPRAAWKK